MRNAKWTAVLLPLFGFLAGYGEQEAWACGGCFVPPPPPTDPSQVVSVITGERMIFSISKDQTTLYDEITYSGKPSSFAWVLPIRGEVEVGLSADILFATIDSLTAATVNPPPENCPPPTNCAYASYSGGGGGCGFGISSSSASVAPGFASFVADAGSANDGGVTVLTQSQVGPYETVQLKSNDGSALTNWLEAHGYNIPASDAATIQHYVGEGMDFLALRLIPGDGVKAMQPVRVTTKGAFPVLPLRMVGVGTGATTGITLWVVADGRWEPANFPFFTIQSSELEWDWKSNSSNYETLRLSKEADDSGRGWQIESSLELNQNSIQSALLSAIQQNFGGQGGYAESTPTSPSGPPPEHDAGPSDARAHSDAAADATDTADAGASEDGASDAASDTSLDAGSSLDAVGADDGALDANEADPPSEEELAEQDLVVLFAGIAAPNARITRMRSDISHSALSDDLTIQASADSSEVSNQYNPTKQVGQPLCPIYDSSCVQTGELPRSQAEAYVESNTTGSGSSGGCGGCRTTNGPLGWRTTCGIVLALAGLGAMRSRSRKRSGRD
jgi:hypothetical protein